MAPTRRKTSSAPRMEISMWIRMKIMGSGKFLRVSVDGFEKITDFMMVIDQRGRGRYSGEKKKKITTKKRKGTEEIGEYHKL